MGQEYILEMKGISKQFSSVKVLHEVDFHIRRGEVHALMGENGAGKSTLIKILTGMYSRDGGTMIFDGKEINPANALEAQHFGISNGNTVFVTEQMREQFVCVTEIDRAAVVDLQCCGHRKIVLYQTQM